MSTSNPEQDSVEHSRKPLIPTTLGGIVLILSVIAAYIIFNTEPEAQREGAVRKTAMLVDIQRVQKRAYTPIIQATGEIQPVREVSLQPLVSGAIVKLHEKFEPGQRVEKGLVLAQIDPQDYELAVAVAESELQQAQAALMTEQGEQERAREDFQQLNRPLDGLRKSLVLREPQLRAAQANVAAAKTRVEQAKLALQRTQIVAPFSAQVVSRSVDIGAQVAPGTSIGRLMGLSPIRVQANIPQYALTQLDVSSLENTGTAPVQVRQRHWTNHQMCNGRLTGVLPNLEAQTRFARVVITISDPQTQCQGISASLNPLLAGGFVQVELPAAAIEDAIRIPLQWLRKGNTVWVLENDVLRVKDVTVQYRDQRYAYIVAGLETNSNVVTTDLSTVVDGAPLRTGGDQEASSE